MRIANADIAEVRRRLAVVVAKLLTLAENAPERPRTLTQYGGLVEQLPLEERNDWLYAAAAVNTAGVAEELGERVAQERVEAAAEVEAGRRARVVTGHELIDMDIPPPEFLLRPAIEKHAIVMLYAERGTGKTNLSLSIACALAAGTSVAGWRAEKPCRVLYVDGEMPKAIMQKRVAAAIRGAGSTFDPLNFRLLLATHQPKGIPNLCTRAGQVFIEDRIDDADLIVFDSISTLGSHGKDNDAESWQPWKEWFLSLRARGLSILFLHHAGKNGEQRGTSAREDIIENSILLAHPSDYQEEEGVRFEVHFKKHRNIYGADVQPFEASMRIEGGAAVWLTKKLEDLIEVRARELYEAELTVREVADALKISPSAAGRLRKKVMR